MPRLTRSIPITLLVGLMCACGGNDLLPVPTTIQRVAASDGQTAPAGGRLASPLAVRVFGQNNEIVTGASVDWTITDGTGAVLSDSLTLSDGTGTAQVWLTLGPTPGAYTVEAVLDGVAGQSVVLNATATAPPVVTAVAPTTFAGGDTVTLTGQALGAVTAVEIGGALAHVLSAASTSVTVLAPICLVPGPVQVRARVDGVRSAAQTATYTADTVALAVGSYASVDPSQLAQGCVTFPAAGSNGAEYLLAAQSQTGSPGASVPYALTGDSLPAPTPPSAAHAGTPVGFAERFDMYLRKREVEIAATPRPPAGPSLQAAPTVQRVNVGDTRTFRVCDIVTCNAASDFAQVTGVAKYVGTHAALFVDTKAPAGGFTQADYDSVGALFDDVLYDVDTRAFGAESDIDHNGVVIILFTPVVNGLTPAPTCNTAIVTGFFFGIDIDPAFASDARSNRGEIFYAVAPDPNGTASCPLSVNQVRQLVPVTFEHEFQHMISYNQHVLVRHGPPEILWLNEGMSHIAEELGGLRFDALGNTARFSQFTIHDLYNASLYLQDPVSHYVLPGNGTGTLEERGASWLFLRWVYDQYGSDLTRAVDETDLTGAENISRATGEPFARLLGEWFLANWVSDLSGFTTPTPLQYRTWDFRQTFASLHQQQPSRFPLAFPLVPPVFDGGAGLSLSGTLLAGSGQYARVVQSAGQGGFTVRLTAPGGGVISGTAVPRLEVIRIR